jgi:hypothetical protein
MPLSARTFACACLLAVLACALPTGALAAKRHRHHRGAHAYATGGADPNDPAYAPTGKAKIVNGVAVAPKGAPPQVVSVIAAANKIIRMPYRYGGGHRSFTDSGYDCSGSVSFALHGANFVSSPLDSSSFMHWGLAGKGRWLTVYTNPGHAFLIVAGLRFDTGWRDSSVKGTYPGSGPRWGHVRPTGGFTARHPAGF